MEESLGTTGKSNISPLSTIDSDKSLIVRLKKMIDLSHLQSQTNCALGFCAACTNHLKSPKLHSLGTGDSKCGADTTCSVCQMVLDCIPGEEAIVNSEAQSHAILKIGIQDSKWNIPKKVLKFPYKSQNLWMRPWKREQTVKSMIHPPGHP
jgi:hypothetical protein